MPHPEPRRTANYLWFKDDELGNGATAAVYKCRHKDTGNVYAVKAFVKSSVGTNILARDREFQILKAIDHPNVVRLLAIEEEIPRGSQCIIMELCNGGSLQTHMAKPEHVYGLPELEFRAVMRDIVTGMKYLRDKGIVHRDIKPLNIMRTIVEDGTAVYKLADFGAARYLKENEAFQSFYGTEEYLHPDIYSAAIMGTSSRKQFTASVDLWSLGVTMYVCATGRLPFVAYGGRRNKAQMHHIITNRQPGIVSGKQEEGNGSIVWSSEYPRDCLLPPEFQEMLLPIQAGLFEVDDERVWSFEKFFPEVTSVLDKQKVRVMDAFSATLHNLYFTPESKFDDLKSAVCAATGVPIRDLLLLCRNAELDEYTAAAAHVLSPALAKADDSSIVFAFNLSCNEQKPCDVKLLQLRVGCERTSYDSLATACRMKVAAEEALNRLQLIDEGVLALLAFHRRTLLAKKVTLDSSSLTAVNAEHRRKALTAFTTGTQHFRQLLQHFTSVRFTEISFDVYIKDMTLSDMMTTFKSSCDEVEEFSVQYREWADKLSQRAEDMDIVQKWKESAVICTTLEDRCRCVGRINEMLSKEQYAKLLAAAAGNKVTSSGQYAFASPDPETVQLAQRYNDMLFSNDCKRLQKLYGECAECVASFVARFSAWKTELYTPYARELKKTISKCENLTDIQDALVKKIDLVTEERDSLVGQIMAQIPRDDNSTKMDSLSQSVGTQPSVNAPTPAAGGSIDMLPPTSDVALDPGTASSLVAAEFVSCDEASVDAQSQGAASSLPPSVSDNTSGMDESPAIDSGRSSSSSMSRQSSETSGHINSVSRRSRCNLIGQLTAQLKSHAAGKDDVDVILDESRRLFERLQKST